MIKLDKNYPPVLIYQMGKVGSSTVKQSLLKTAIKNPLFYVHYLSWKSIHSVENYFANKSMAPPSHIQYSKIVRQLIDLYKGQIRFKIVSLVRDPVARNISSTFQNVNLGLPHIKNVTKKQAICEISDYLSGCVLSLMF